MKLTSFKKIAAVSAVALGVAVAGGAHAVQIGSPVVIPINATVENTITVTVTTPVSFGTVGAIRHTTDTASLAMNAAGVVTEDPGTGYGGTDPAAMVFDPVGVAQPAAGVIDVTAAFENTELYVTYQNCVNPALAGEIFTLSAIVDNLATPGSFDCAAAAVIGHETTDGTGALQFNVGATITTTTISNAAYTDGAYVGSVEAVFSY